MRSVTFSKANDDIVVNPPQKPAVKKTRQSAGIIYRSETPTAAPITRDPRIFTTKVPVGKVTGNKTAISSTAAKRATAPNIPPIATKMTLLLIVLL